LSLLLFLDKNQHKISLFLEGSDFFQNLSQKHFFLGSQKSDFMSFFIKKWHSRSDFFRNLSLQNFFRDNVSILRKKIAAPLVAKQKKTKFCSRSTQECKYQQRYRIIRTGFLTVFDLFKPTVKCDKKSALWSEIMHSQLWQAAVSKPVKQGQSYIPIWKVLCIGNWNQK